MTQASLRGIDTNLVVALHALLHDPNVTRAAKTVGIGQSSLSHALARLRLHFGDPLLVKVGRGMVLTERARALLSPVDAAVRSLSTVFAPPAAFDPGVSRRTFRVVSTDNVEVFLLPHLVQLLAAEAPGVDLSFHHLGSDWQNELRRGACDLKLGRKAPLPEGLRNQDLFRERLVCVLRRGHPLAPARKKALTLERYLSLGHVVVAPTTAVSDAVDDWVDRALRGRKLSRRVALVVTHFLAAPFVVASSDLCLTVSESLVQAFRPLLPLVAHPMPFGRGEYRLSQVWSAHADADPGHRWLRGVVARAARAAASAERMVG